ncbi:MAG TPA: hypothetical protein VJA22_02905, partial [Patescibacteria group bacterium]|nr:hypothetical protein [Patescibacteria group bacterium]
QSDFERAAPMSVYPHPDSIIRVFMDYLPLDSLRSIKPQELMTPKRDGFTVVEWGGTLYQ